MPIAKPPLPKEPVAPLASEEAQLILKAVRAFYGPDAVVRTYGPDPARLMLHVETSAEPGMEQYDCAGVLYARLEREEIGFEVTRRGTKPRGEAKIAYRQGVTL